MSEPPVVLTPFVSFYNLMGFVTIGTLYKPVTHQAGGLSDNGGYVCHENAVELSLVG
jgi:hypothetical protein